MTYDDLDLSLHEELFLLGVDTEKGTLRGSEMRTQLALALAADLLLAGRISIVEPAKRIVGALDGPEPGHPLLSEGLRLVQASSKPWTLRQWVEKFARIPDLKGRTAAALEQRRLLAVGERNLWFFRLPAFRLTDPRARLAVVGALHAAIFGGASELQARPAVLVGLARNADLLGACFERWEIRERKERIEQIVRGKLYDRRSPEANAQADAAGHLFAAMKELKEARQSHAVVHAGG
jgi:hypothetical protein